MVLTWARGIVFTLGGLGLAYGIWLYFGGDLGSFLQTVSNVGGGIISTIGHVFAGLLNGLFGHHAAT